MLKVILISDLSHPDRESIQDFLNEIEGALIDKCAFFDLGSKKTQRKARSYLSKYAASEIFVVFEKTITISLTEDEYGDPIEPISINKTEVVDVLYKEQVSNWKDDLMFKINKIKNEYK